MRLHEQNSERKKIIEDIKSELEDMRASIHRKMNAPFGDGSKSNMVNAESDVLPRIAHMLQIVGNDPAN